MTGLDKIIGQIKSESDATAASITDKARAEADKVIAKARTEAEGEIETIKMNGEVAAKNAISRSKSQAELIKRQAVLAEKQRLIAEMFDKAEVYVKKMPEDVYFKLITKMVKRYAVKGKSGEILFNKEDAGRLPAGFSRTVSLAAEEKGSKLTLSDKTVNIDGGFILSYGGIEENCSIKALIDDQREKIQDDIQKLLFS